MINALLFSWDKNLSYMQRLLADVPQEKMIYQPEARVNHPAWLLCHMNLYHPVIVAMLQGQPVIDPKDHPFGMASKPLADASIYPAKAKLLEDFAAGHAAVGQALRNVDTAVLQQPTPLERWQTAMGNLDTTLTYLMITHESTHLGQLSAWRRVQGLPSV